eukprot:sb/3464664/
MNLRGWMALIGPFVTNFSVASASFIMSPFYAIHLTEEGVPRVLIGIFGLMPAIGFFSNIPVDIVNTALTRKLLTPKQINVIAVFLECIITALTGTAHYLFPLLGKYQTMGFLMILRWLHGWVCFLVTNSSYFCYQTWIPDIIKFASAFGNSGCWAGCAVGAWVGGQLFYRFGWAYTFFCWAGVQFALNIVGCCILPSGDGPVWRPKDSEPNDTVAMATPEEHDKDGLTPLAMLAYLAMGLMEVVSGCITAILSTYLLDKFEISIAHSSNYIFIYLIAITVASQLAGIILQSGLLRSAEVLAFGGFLVGFSIFLLFPQPADGYLYSQIPYTAYLATIILGTGVVMASMATLFLVEDLQVKLCHRTYNSTNKSLNVTLWLNFMMAFCYSGNLVALLFLQYLSFEQCGVILGSLSSVTIATGVSLEALLRWKGAYTNNNYTPITDNSMSG